MDLVIWIYALSALASAVAALLAWLAKLRWAKEYAVAKDETIKAKQAEIERLLHEVQSVRELTNDVIKAKDIQIQLLSDLTPMKIREYFLSVRTQLEEYIENLKSQIIIARMDERTKATKEAMIEIGRLADEMYSSQEALMDTISKELEKMKMDNLGNEVVKN